MSLMGQGIWEPSAFRTTPRFRVLVAGESGLTFSAAGNLDVGPVSHPLSGVVTTDSSVILLRRKRQKLILFLKACSYNSFFSKIVVRDGIKLSG